MKKNIATLKTLLIALIAIFTFGKSHTQIAVKTQIPGLVNMVARTISKSFRASHPMGPYVFLELEKGIGAKSSIVAYGAIRRERVEGPPSYWGRHYLESSGYKIGLAYRRYLGARGPMEGFFLQPTFQLWDGKFDAASGDTFADGHRTGGSLTLHGGYQMVIGAGFLIDASLGLGVGTEKNRSERSYYDYIAGYHRLRGFHPGLGWAGDVRLGVGWMF